MVGQIVVLLMVVLHTAFAFHDTHPLLAWSSIAASALDALPTFLGHRHSAPVLLAALLDAPDTCAHDAVVVIYQPGLHAADLRALRPTSRLATNLAGAPSARQYPYIPAAQIYNFSHSVAAEAEAVATRCRARLLYYTPGGPPLTLEHGAKHVLAIKMPPVLGTDRTVALDTLESMLETELAAVAEAFPNMLVIYTGTPLAPHILRHAEPLVRRVLRAQPDLPTHAAQPGGILKRFQLLTPGLITSLLVTFFILVPILLFGIRALASINIPIKVGMPKDFDARERKNQ